MHVLLLSTYELGHQPFGLASPTAWLRQAGHRVTCADLAVQQLPADAAATADVIALYVPMHTATRLAAALIPKLRALNPAARLGAFGLYAPLNADYLSSLGCSFTLGGEFEAALVAAIEAGTTPAAHTHFPRLPFLTPDRSTLPGPDRYAPLITAEGPRTVGYTEASRGCKHLCRHCPVVPVYQGKFRIVPVNIVLADIRQQIAQGATHITFGDPDFWNGPTHAQRIVTALHIEFPHVTYDATIKVEHLHQHRQLLPVLKDTGCLMITSAVESLQDEVLEKLQKGHNRADFHLAAALCRAHGLTLIPTFIPFTPWTTRASYRDLLQTLAEEDLIDHVSPIQLALRLLITQGSRLLELPDILARITHYDSAALLYRWQHADPEMDTLAAQALSLASRRNVPRHVTFNALSTLADAPLPPVPAYLLPRATVPYLNEPWYC